YSFTLRYSPEMLAPLLPPRSDARMPVTSQMISSSAGWSFVRPGEVRIVGAIKPGSRSGILVGLPMKVLLGQLPVTALTPDSIALQPGAFIPLAIPGHFTAPDC